jgi:mRNA interferase MazF
VLLSKGEGTLSKAGVINVSQLFTVDKSDLEQKIGTLSSQRVEQILQGIDLLLKPREVRS